MTRMRSPLLRWTGAAFLAATALVGCAGSSGEDLPHRPTSTVSFAGTSSVLHVGVADTEGARRQGLMGVEHLPADQGMAFVYEEPVMTTFWMKNTPIPLSIAFVDDSGAIVTIRDMRPCTSEACPRYRADAPYVLAIEANLGWFDARGIGVGDRATLEPAAYG